METLTKTVPLIVTLFATGLAFPSNIPEEAIRLKSINNGEHQVSEASDPVEVLLYRTLLREKASKFHDENPQAAGKEDSDTNYPDDEVLAQLKALQSAGVGQKDGRWLDQIQDVVDLLPPNYHNSTEYQTQIGNEDVDVKENIDKTSDDYSESMWLSKVVQMKSQSKRSKFECSLAHPCELDEYCYETHFASECKACLVLGAECEEDAQCCSTGRRENFCVNGQCRATTRGSAGTICSVSEDCNAGLCCAQDLKTRHRICKPLSRPGEQCIKRVEMTQDVLVLDDNDFFCPCETGLVCSDSDVVVYGVVPMKYEEGLFCIVPEDKGLTRGETKKMHSGYHCFMKAENYRYAKMLEKPIYEKDPNWLDETSNPVRIPNGSSLNQGYLDSVQQARLGDEQSYKKLLPFLVNSKQTGEIPEDGPSM